MPATSSSGPSQTDPPTRSAVTRGERGSRGSDVMLRMLHLRCPIESGVGSGGCMDSSLNVVILAAGEGKRMGSSLPKVLQPIAARPMLAHVIDTARVLSPAAIHIVHGHEGEAVRAAFAGCTDLNWVEQAQRLGTGHAVQQAMPAIPDTARVL